jgi:hypothetical protein
MYDVIYNHYNTSSFFILQYEISPMERILFSHYIDNKYV